METKLQISFLNFFQEFTKARYVRLRLQKIRTLNADLMTIGSSDPENIDKLVTRRVR